jgi:gas vesicle protein
MEDHSMFGRIPLIIYGVIILMGALTGIYYSWRSGIEREALLEYNQKQLEQNIKDQQILKQKIADMDKIQEEITAHNAADKKQFKDKLDNINTDIDNNKDGNKPASDILKKTVAKLKDAPK